jgi:Fic family protein
MEPLLPEDRDGRLDVLALELIRKAERLGGRLHPVTRRTVAGLVRSMNSYYSNLIEGHRTTPADIEAALQRKFSRNSTHAALQQEHLAHVEVQNAMETRLASESALGICSAAFIAWLHHEFFRRLPESLCQSPDLQGRVKQVVPGQIRNSEVVVGRHVAPASANLGAFLQRFAEGYGPLVNDRPASVLAAAAAHHRLAWMHPFLDGNGRVVRLFSQAWFERAGLASGGLWTLARGLARQQPHYQSALAGADEPRRHDFDGRGLLTERGLTEFCEFFLRTAIDQVAFMDGLLALDTMLKRIQGFAARQQDEGQLPAATGLVLREVFLRGEIARGEVARIASTSARTAQKITGQLLRRGLLHSDSPKGPVRFGVPASAAGAYFPNLFPAGAPG